MPQGHPLRGQDKDKAHYVTVMLETDDLGEHTDRRTNRNETSC